MRLLIFGGRHLDSVEVAAWLSENIGWIVPELTHVIHGNAPGVDTGAGLWASVKGIPQTRFKADWRKYGKGAGHVRNQQMIDEGKPDAALELPGGKGTANMHDRCLKAGIPLTIITKQQLKETGYVEKD